MNHNNSSRRPNRRFGRRPGGGRPQGPSQGHGPATQGGGGRPHGNRPPGGGHHGGPRPQGPRPYGPPGGRDQNNNNYSNNRYDDNHNRPPQQGGPPPARQAQAVAGTFELNEQGDGNLRDPKKNYAIQPGDAQVPVDLVRRWRLRGGETIAGCASIDPRSARARLVEVEQINGGDPAAHGQLTPFEDLTVIDPRVPIRFETPGGPATMRVIDLMTPMGRGQRGLIVAPPRTGKTVLLTQMAAGVRANAPDVKLMMLLIDERPEEVTDMRRTIGAASADPNVDPPEVVFSSNDKDVESHVRLSRLMIARAKRRVERGEHVLILLDSLTRLGRAFNHFVGSSGRTMSGGIDIRALTEPKAMFGAARNIEHGGSLTIIASALIDTGSRMDEFIFQEFKGTGNMEIVLSRELANQRIWPAIDLAQSGTRKEELLHAAEDMNKIHRIRRKLMSMGLPQQMDTLLKELGFHKSNRDYLSAMAG